MCLQWLTNQERLPNLRASRCQLAFKKVPQIGTVNACLLFAEKLDFLEIESFLSLTQIFTFLTPYLKL